MNTVIVLLGRVTSTWWFLLSWLTPAGFHLTPVRSEWKTSWEVPNARWCECHNQGNRVKRMKSFCRKRKNMHIKSHYIPPGIDKGSSAPQTKQKNSPEAQSAACKGMFQVLWILMLCYPAVQIAPSDTAKRSNKAHCSTELAWTATYIVSFSYYFFTPPSLLSHIDCSYTCAWLCN